MNKSVAVVCGVAGLAAGLCGGAAAQAYEIDVVAMTGDPAPAGDGVIDRFGGTITGRAVMGEDGRVYFFASIDSPVVAGDYSGLYRADAHSLETVARSDDPIMNAAGVSLTNPSDEFVVSASGRVAFTGRPDTHQNHDGLYVSSVGEGVLAIAQETESTPDGRLFTRLGFNEIAHTMNEHGEVAFTASTSGIDGRSTYLWSDGALTAVATPGNQLPGATDLTIRTGPLPVVTAEGSVWFAAEWTDWGDLDGLFAWQNGAVDAVVLPSTLVPGVPGKQFGIRGGYTLSGSSASSQVAFWSNYDDRDFSSYFLADTSTATRLPFYSDCLPGFGCGHTVNRESRLLAMNGVGQSLGMFRWRSSTDQISHYGMLLADSESVTPIEIADRPLQKGGIFAAERTARSWAINDAGTIVFNHAIDLIPDDSACCFDEGIFVTDAGGEVVEIIRNGDTLAGSIVEDLILAGTGNETSVGIPQNADGINEDGQIAFWFYLENGRYGMAIASPVTTCLPDANGDGLVSPTDFNAWIIAYNSQAPACDQNRDSLCTPQDFSAWVQNYNAGCQ